MYYYVAKLLLFIRENGKERYYGPKVKIMLNLVVENFCVVVMASSCTRGPWTRFRPSGSKTPRSPKDLQIAQDH